MTNHFIRILKRIFLILFIFAVFFSIVIIHQWNFFNSQTVAKPIPFISSVDTMKESRDTETYPLTMAQIQRDVKASASLGVSYITVDTHWDYPVYMKKWIDTIRKEKKHVWFRLQANQWEESNYAAGIMTPAAYEAAMKSFILKNPMFFKSGDIFDPCPEPEQGHYWSTTYGSTWSYNAPNTATHEYNAFIRDTSSIAQDTFKKLDILGIQTNIRSINSYFATHPEVFEKKTVALLGLITVDSYPEEKTLSPQVATTARLAELKQIYELWHVPIIIGEMGYSNELNVDDTTQSEVLNGEFNAILTLPYIQGVNYWVGLGSYLSGGYTHILSFNGTTWQIRPGGYDLIRFFKKEALIHGT